MWVAGPGVVLRGELALTLTHLPFARQLQIPRTFHPRFVHSSTSTKPPTLTRMASDNAPEWTAPKVRETFLNYFKENGHTFGE
jgi:alanyl-tRNA synthetase